MNCAMSSQIEGHVRSCLNTNSINDLLRADGGLTQFDPQVTLNLEKLCPSSIFDSQYYRGGGTYTDVRTGPDKVLGKITL